MMADNKKTFAIEKSDIMNLKLSDIYDNADSVSSDRKKHTLLIKYIDDDFAINIEIKKADSINDVETLWNEMSDIEQEVWGRIDKGQRQVEIANELDISQATVSGIKTKYPSLLELVSKSAPESILSTLFEKKTKLKQLREATSKDKTIERIVAVTSENKKNRR